MLRWRGCGQLDVFLMPNEAHLREVEMAAQGRDVAQPMHGRAATHGERRMCWRLLAPTWYAPCRRC